MRPKTASPSSLTWGILSLLIQPIWLIVSVGLQATLHHSALSKPLKAIAQEFIPNQMFFHLESAFTKHSLASTHLSLDQEVKTSLLRKLKKSTWNAILFIQDSFAQGKESCNFWI